MILALTAVLSTARGASPPRDERSVQLAQEVRDKGWIVCGARGENRTWDLFLSRPDGSQRRALTNTPDFEEGAPRFSPDGSKLLFRRVAAGTTLSHDTWGFQGRLMIANAHGTNPQPVGVDKEYPWGVWSPDGKQISCLTLKGIQIVDLATKTVVRQWPRKGIYQQLFWSPDGKWACGVANLGEAWTIVRLNIETGELNAVHRFQSCTPDWFPDSRRIIYSSRPAGQRGYGWTQLWMADGDGQHAELIYGEDGRHIYGGALSPDGKYVLFSRGTADGGGSESSGAPLCIMRLADAPTIGGPSQDLRAVHPKTKDGPILHFADGWEPHWTYAEVGGKP
jgi:Tol biopolymer transport system component